MDAVTGWFWRVVCVVLGHDWRPRGGWHRCKRDDVPYRDRVCVRCDRYEAWVFDRELGYWLGQD